MPAASAAPHCPPDPAAAYQPRRYDTPLYRLVLDHWEKFVSVYDDAFATRYDELRPVVEETYRKYLDCGILAHGFLRVRCSRCRYEIQVPWSCKRGMCPSCSQRRALEFGEFIDREVLEPVPYIHLVASIPKVLRPTFLRERRLLRELSRCVWKVVKRALRVALKAPQAVPGAVAALATAGDILNANSHVHMILSAGAWSGKGPDATFLPWPSCLTAERLTELLRRSVLAMLARRQRLTEDTAARLLSWGHSGFSIWYGVPIQPWETESRQRLARYLIKAPVSLERLHYDETACRVVYTSDKRGQTRSMSALEFLAELGVHIPDRGSHGVLFYGRHSKRSRGERARHLEARGATPSTLPAVGSDVQHAPGTNADPCFLQKRRAGTNQIP